MLFFVQVAGSPASCRVPVDIFSSSTQWSSAKIRIAKLLDLPLSRCRFLHKGKILNDKLGSLHQCNIKGDDVVIVQELPQSPGIGAETSPPTVSYTERLPELELGEGTVASYICNRCRRTPSRKICLECGCHECGVKDDDAENIVCEECMLWFHWRCLDPPLTSLPDDNWFCKGCKNDPSIVVKPGDAVAPTKQPMKDASGREWGRGMANVGHAKTCTIVPPTHRGPIPGIEVGQLWKYRIFCGEDGVHRPLVAGIAGSAASGGAVSIVLSDGYPEDVDKGETFTYTGSGGRDFKKGGSRTAVQSFDQELAGANLHLAETCDAPIDKDGASAKDWRKSKGIRVVRGYKLMRFHPEYAPASGYRYDGIYKIVKYYPARGASGHRVYRYDFRRDDEAPAPWTDEGKRRTRKLGLEMVASDRIQNQDALRKIDPLAVAASSLAHTDQRISQLLEPRLNARSSRKHTLDSSSPRLIDHDFDNFCPTVNAAKKRKRGSINTPGLVSGRLCATAAPGTPANPTIIKEQEDVVVDLPQRSSSLALNMPSFLLRDTRSMVPQWTVPEALKFKIERAKAPNHTHMLFEKLLAKPFCNLRDFVLTLENELACPICQEFVKVPVTSPCGHIACLKCLEISVRSNFGPRCSLCRACLVEGIGSDKSIDKMAPDEVESIRSTWRRSVKVDKALVDIIRFCVPSYCASLDVEEEKKC